MEEIWKDIEGYEGLYQISNLGRIRSLDRVVVTKRNTRTNLKGMLLKSTKDRDGYLQVVLSKQSKLTTVKVHRVVAKHFIDNPENKTQINHLNGVKNDNRVENINWCTNSENNKHAYDTNLKKPRGKWISLDWNAKKVEQYDLKNNFICSYDSIAKASNALGISKTSISRCCSGHSKTTIKYVFKYATKSNQEKQLRLPLSL